MTIAEGCDSDPLAASWNFSFRNGLFFQASWEYSEGVSDFSKRVVCVCMFCKLHKSSGWSVPTLEVEKRGWVCWFIWIKTDPVVAGRPVGLSRRSSALQAVLK